MIITVGGIKGGSGKTTVAVSLAVLLSNYHKVLLVDADKQATATDFATLRADTLGNSGFTAITLADKQVRTEVLKLAPQYDYVVIDTGGRDTTSQRAALTVCDVYLVPFAPKSFDIWTLEQVGKLIEETSIVNSDRQDYAILNKTDNNENDSQEAREFLEEGGFLKVFKSYLRERKAFSNGAAEGLAVTEMKRKDYKAITELQNLFNEITSLKIKREEVA